MDNLIEQLKKNEKPFGLMSEEMQVKIKKIGKENCEYYSTTNMWFEGIRISGFYNENTYRLRPDYAEKPEIEECEITLNPESNIWGYKCPCSGDPVNADLAHSCPGFRLIGFKFEDDPVIYDSPIIYSFKDDTFRDAHLEHLRSGEAKVLDASYVLFRRQE